MLLLIWISVFLLGTALASGFHIIKIPAWPHIHQIVSIVGLIGAIVSHLLVLRRSHTVLIKKLLPHILILCPILLSVPITGLCLSNGQLSRSIHAWSAYMLFLYHVHISTLESIYMIRSISKPK